MAKTVGVNMVITDKGLAILDEAGNKLADFGDEADNAGESTRGMGVAAVALGGLIQTGITAALSLAKDAIVGFVSAGAEFVSLSNAQEDAVAGLNQALKTAGDFSVAASEGMQTFATKLQNVTGIGDEVSLELLKLAKSFGASNEQAKGMVAAAADFAIAADINMTEALRRLGRATQGSTDDIAKFVPAIKELTKEQLAAGEATRLIAERFAGAAAEAAETFSGRMNILSGRVSDAKEKLGDFIKAGLEPLLPVFEKAITKGEAFIKQYGEQISAGLQKAGEFMAEMAKRFKAFTDLHSAEAIQAAADALKLLVDAGAGAVKIGALMIESYGLVREAFATLAVKLKPLILLWAELADLAIIPGSDALSETLKDVAAGLDANVEAQQKFADKTREMADGVRDITDELSTRFKGGIDDASESLQGMTQSVIGLKDEDLVAGLRAMGEATEQVAAKTNEFVDGWGQTIIIPPMIEDIVAAEGQAVVKTDELAAAADEAAGALEQAGSAGGAMGQAVAAGAEAAKQALQVMVVGTKRALADIHADAVAAASSTSDAFKNLKFTTSVGGGSGQRGGAEGGDLERLIKRARGATKGTAGFFRRTVKAFEDELAGGQDVGKLRNILDTIIANQNAIQSITNRGDLPLDQLLNAGKARGDSGSVGVGTADNLRGVVQVLTQILTEVKNPRPIDGPSFAGELQDLVERNGARR